MDAGRGRKQRGCRGVVPSGAPRGTPDEKNGGNYAQFLRENAQDYSKVSSTFKLTHCVFVFRCKTAPSVWITKEMLRGSKTGALSAKGPPWCNSSFLEVGYTSMEADEEIELNERTERGKTLVRLGQGK